MLSLVAHRRFTAKDPKGGVAPAAIVTVNMCDCSGNGDCLFTELAADQKEASKFRVVACKCNVGYAGMTFISWRTTITHV